jgi:DNA (cytosine-5)-methyltransferase 1
MTFNSLISKKKPAHHFKKNNMKHGSLFSGIGGFDLASEWMGWENVFHCEWNPFGQKVLNHYWPKAITYHDITKTDFTIHRGAIDILTGGFPCQPYSSAGKRLGKEDERHLWPEMLRAIREIQPTWVVGENVRGLTNWNGGLVFDEVQAELEAQGYEVTPFLLPACAVNAPHRRDRIWFVAYNNSLFWREGGESKSTIQSRYGESNEDSNTKINGDASESDLLRRDKCIKQYEIYTGQRGVNAFGNIDNCAFNGDATNPMRIRLEHTKETRDISESERKTRTKRSESSKSFEANGINGNVTDSDGIGQECRQERKRSEGRSQSNDKFTKRRNKLPGADFEMFPTVAPICDGDDGISDRLDSITFPKWRNESIKAGGNAIVPQVVHQIFKAIEQYNELNKQLSI